MIPAKDISIFILRVGISAFLCLLFAQGFAQKHKPIMLVPDTLSTFRGVQVMVDLVGVVQKAVSDYGQYEAGLRVNIKDKYFPVMEVGYGFAEHLADAVTNISYKSKAPYARVGVDFNLLKNKQDIYRFYLGVRYAFTSYKFDVGNSELMDPVWKDKLSMMEVENGASQHWGELVASVDTKIWKAIHLGWSVRYKRRISHQESEVGKSWYVPGYGKTGSTRLGATFNVIVEI